MKITLTFDTNDKFLVEKTIKKIIKKFAKEHDLKYEDVIFNIEEINDDIVSPIEKDN